MKTKNISTTNDLASVVLKKLNSKSNLEKISKETLELIFETLFFVSLKTEEGQFIKLTATFISEEETNSTKINGWNTIKFENKIEFNVKSIVKLAKAADPWSSSIAIYPNELGKLFIWGMIDQSIHYQSFLNFETEIKVEQAGIFQTSITGIGKLIVVHDYKLLATLNQSELTENYVDIFNSGCISEMLKKHTNSIKQKIINTLKRELEFSPTISDFSIHIEYINKFWTDSITRIILKIQNYNHGGAFLITNSNVDDLKIKYSIQYDRLEKCIENLSMNVFENWHFYSILSNQVNGYDVVSSNDYSKNVTTEEFIIERKNELKGIIRFIASLSCVDGLVVMDSMLKVKGFGAVVQDVNSPEYIYLSKTATINDKKLQPIQSSELGTRHQSMFSYCFKNEGSIGFVISQDGNVRAMTKVNDKLIIWDNIKVQRLTKLPSIKIK